MLINIVKQNTYYDSVTLMSVTQKVSVLEDVLDAAVMMATDHNKEILRHAELLNTEGEKASSSDMLICIKCTDEKCLEKALEEIDKALNKSSSDGEQQKVPIRSLTKALEKLPEANLAIISVPGEYAAREAHKALDNGLNVFLFSDNVSLEEEIELKEKAVLKELLVMGPDCGTAYINGKGIGFANVVRSGDIGIVAASGTGLQEVASLISEKGGGISHAIGTGGRDLKEAVGGRTMLQGIKMLTEDDKTKVIVLISKPPSPLVEKNIFETISSVKKPVVICFLGGSIINAGNNETYFAHTLEETAALALAVSKGRVNIEKSLNEECFELREIANVESEKYAVNQKYVRGLFSGGTLCYEALLIFQNFIGDVYSNVPIKPHLKLGAADKSREHAFIDLGDDEFTEGRPHPMIDPSLRAEKILTEVRDPETAVILLDVLLGYGSHCDPAGALVPKIKEAQAMANQEQKHISFIASLCGTQNDPQGYEKQLRKLEGAGVIVMDSNAQAARLAVEIVQNLTNKGGRENEK
ncbi:MAG: acyl-CoA synthetase FdrA [Bacillota bacterium]